MARLQVVEIESMGGGVNSYNRSDKIRFDETTSQSRNIRLEGEMFKPRQGYVTFADELAGGVKINNLSVYKRKQASDDRLITFYNNKIYRINPDTEITWTEISQSFITSSANINTVYFHDWLFVFNGVDKPLRIEDTTVTQPFIKPDSLPSADDFKPSFGAIYNGSLFVAGVPSAPNSVFISKASTTANPEYVYDFSGALSSFGDANELVLPSRVTAIRNLATAVVVFTVDEAFYIPGLKDFGTSVTFEVQPIGGADGAVSQKSTTVVENDIYYLTPQKEIRSIKRGFADTLSMITTPLSVNIQEFLNISTDSDFSDAFSVYNPIEKEYHLYIPKSNEPSNTLRIVGDTTKIDQYGVPAWGIDDNCPFSSGVVYQGKTYAGSSALGQVYVVNFGLADDDSSNIVTKRVTKDYTAGTPISLKNFRGIEVFGEITISTQITCNIYVDDVLVATYIISKDDIPATSLLIGGIGTESIGDVSIGDTVEEGFDDIVQRHEFVKRMPFRRTGKKMRAEFLTDGINQDYRIRHMRYVYIPKSLLYSSVIEK